MTSTDDRVTKFSHRLALVRAERFGSGEFGVFQVSKAIGIPPGTWRNFESGISVPGEILLKFIVETNVNPQWLLDGKGHRYMSPEDESTLDFKLGPQGK